MICSNLPQVVVDPSDYSTLLDALKSGKDDLDFRKRLAWKAYQHTATYDSTVAEWMWSQIGALLPYTTDTTAIFFVPSLCRRTWGRQAWPAQSNAALASTCPQEHFARACIAIDALLSDMAVMLWSPS